jgi:hypothetical protein
MTRGIVMRGRNRTTPSTVSRPMTRSVMTRSSSILATALVLAACSMQTPSPASISAAVAGSAAVAQVGGGQDVKVVSTRLSTYGAEAHGGAAVDPNTQVWAVLLSGAFGPLACGTPAPSPQACSGIATSALVLIDARTGTFIQSEKPAPSP